VSCTALGSAYSARKRSRCGPDDAAPREPERDVAGDERPDDEPLEPVELERMPELLDAPPHPASARTAAAETAARP
jgi:hypothetical protein